MPTSSAVTARPEFRSLHLGRYRGVDGFEINVLTDERRAPKEFKTFEGAHNAAARLSTGDAKAAAGVFALGESFYVQPLDIRYRQQGPNGEWYGPYREDWTWMEANSRAPWEEFKPYRRGEVAQGLREIVDGSDVTIAVAKSR